MPDGLQQQTRSEFESNRRIEKKPAVTKRKKRHSIDSGSIRHVKAPIVEDNTVYQSPTQPVRPSSPKVISEEMAERRRLEKIALEVRSGWTEQRVVYVRDCFCSLTMGSFV